MKTRTTVLLTAIACFTLVTLFAYCTKDTPNPQGNGGGAAQSTLNLEGTTWKSSIQGMMVNVHFTTNNSGNFSYTGEETYTKNFTYSVYESHGAIFTNAEYGFVDNLPQNPTILLINDNLIGIGGHVFTRQ